MIETLSLEWRPLLLLLVGIVIALTTLVRSVLGRLSLPALVGYLSLGVLINALDRMWPFLTPEVEHGFRFLQDVGVVVLLFRIGLESNLPALVHQMRRASELWAGNITLSAGLAFIATFVVLSYGLLPSLFVTAALTATSVGVSTAVWNEAGAIGTDTGALLIDVAELDDISAVIFMSVLFASVPSLHSELGGASLSAIGREVGFLILKFIGFCAGCFLFSKYVEAHLTSWFGKLDPDLGPMLLVVGLGFCIAVLAAWLGFSLAIGAMFAGLAFSRDPREKRIDRSFAALFGFFSPFFFIGIGLSVEMTGFGQALGLGAVLLAVAVAGKIVGTWLTAAATVGGTAGVLIGVSMVPRAEVAMIIMQHGRALGDWAVPPELFAAMVLVTLATCLFTPPVVHLLLRKHLPPAGRSQEREP